MILQRGNLAGLEGACGGKLYGSFFLLFFLQFFFISLQFFFFFCDSGIFVFFVVFFFIKHLRSRTPTQYKQRPPIPTPGAPAGLGALGDPLGFLCGCFPGVWHRWAGAGFWGGGICTALPWGDGHKKGNLNKKTTKSRGPTKTGTTLGKGPGAQ